MPNEKWEESKIIEPTTNESISSLFLQKDNARILYS